MGPARRTGRRDTARRPAVSIRHRSADRGQDRTASHDGRAGDPHRQYRAARGGSAGRRRHHQALRGNPRREALHHGQLRCPHRVGRHSAGGSHFPQDRGATRGVRVHRQLPHPALRRRVDDRRDAAHGRGVGLLRGPRGPAGHVRDGGHDPCGRGDAEGSLRQRDTSGGSAGSASPIPWATPRRRASGRFSAS